jgi:hypothetical protein
LGKKESRVVFWKGNFGNMGIIISDIRVALERVRQLRGVFTFTEQDFVQKACIIS